jgi:hypothetical protein
MSQVSGGYQGGPRPTGKPPKARAFAKPPTFTKPPSSPNKTPAVVNIVNVDTEPVLVDKRTACRLLGNIAERTLRQLVHDGELNARKLGTRTVFEPDELRRFAAALPSWEPEGPQ